MTVSKRIAVVLLLLIPRDLCYAEKESSVLPIEAFASLPRVSSVRFSPSGKYLAVLRNENGMTYLMTQLASGADPHVVVNSDNSEYFIQDYQWVNDERLLVGVRFGSSRERVESVETRLMAVNRDGTEAKHSLIAPRRDALLADHYSQSQDRIIGQMPGDQRHVLIALDKENPNIPNVYQLDVYSGGLTLVQANPGNREGIGAIRHWLADRQGRVRAGISDSKTMRRVMIRRKSSGQWEELVEFDRTKERGIVPLGFDENPDILYVRATHEGRWAVFKVNPEEPRAPRQLVAADPHMDIDGELLYSRWLRAVVGVAHSSVRRPYLYWDERFQRLHSRLDRLLPGRHTRIVSSTDDGKRHVVVSVSAVHAVQYLVFDSEHERLVKLAQAYPALRSEDMRPVKAVTIPARDGLALPAYLTVPVTRSAGPVPLIVFPHGGPHSRDTGTFDPWTQFFASRGWAVLQINFRGSTGQSEAFERAGFRQWGLQMQDDLTDGVGWAVQQGVADSSRICIVGASYGGYAALMGAIRTPDLYRCAISIAGVSDLRKLVDEQRFYLGTEISADTRIGRWGSDRKQLDETSPVAQASKIQTPVLLLHGAADVVVPVGHSRDMADA